MSFIFQPLDEGQRTDTAWLKSTLREINHKIKDADKKLLALKGNIDDAKVNVQNNYIIWMKPKFNIFRLTFHKKSSLERGTPVAQW